MINVSEIVNDPDFTELIVIQRTSGSETVGGIENSGTVTILTVSGVCVNPKGTKSIELTPQGAKATGFIDIYVDASIDLYTSDTSDGYETSDVIFRYYGQPSQQQYRVINVRDYKRYGYTMAEAQRMGGI